MILSLALSLALAAEPITLVDANINVHSDIDCPPFGHTKLVVDGVNGATTPRTVCIGVKALTALTDNNVKTTLANVQVTQAETDQLLALNEQTFDQKKHELEVEAHLEAYKTCFKSLEGDGNVTCSIDGDVIKRVSDPVGEAQANSVNRWPDGIGGYYGGIGHLSTAQALDAMDQAEQMLNNQGEQSGKSTGVKTQDKPAPPPKIVDDNVE